MYSFLLFFFLIFAIYLYRSNKLIIDNPDNKSHSIHKSLTPRNLGFLFLSTPFFFYEFKYDIFLIISLSSIIISIPGFLEDFNLNLSPIVRLIMQFFLILLILIQFNEFFILKSISFLNILESNNIFLFFITFFAFWGFINAINFIDGLNGLLILYVLLIFTFLSIISNFPSYFLIIIIFLIFILFFNFPFSFFFLGDFGSYFIGSFIGLSMISISNNLISINNLTDFHIINFLIYPIIETIYSIFRRIKISKSPFSPDNLHLHSLLHKYFLRKTNYSNPITSLSIIVYLGIFFFIAINLNNVFFLILLAISQIIIYVIIYKILIIFLFKNNKKKVQ